MQKEENAPLQGKGRKTNRSSCGLPEHSAPSLRCATGKELLEFFQERAFSPYPGYDIMIKICE